MSDELNEDLDLDESLEEEDTSEENIAEDEDLEEGTDDDRFKKVLAQKKHWREKAVKEAEARKKLEEQIAKSNQPEKTPDKDVQPSQNYVARDEYEEGILRTSKGYEDEDIDVLKIISKGKGVTLFQAEQDAMFKLHRENKAEEERRAKAQLPASKGSGSSDGKKEPKTRDEHMEIWKERSGR